MMTISKRLNLFLFFALMSVTTVFSVVSYTSMRQELQAANKRSLTESVNVATHLIATNENPTPETLSEALSYIPQVGVDHELVAKYRQKQKELYLSVN